MPHRFQQEIDAALASALHADTAPQRRVEHLVEVAIEIQRQATEPDEILGLIKLYRKALELCPSDHDLLRARTGALLATALQHSPADDPRTLEEAVFHLEAARPVVGSLGTAEEAAEIDVHRGLAIQALAATGRKRVAEAITAYESALHTFRAATHPEKFALLKNNIATALLSLPASDKRASRRGTLAVRSLEEGLKAVRRADQPHEYAMLQNSLGNVFQYAATGRRAESRRRALAAYEEALRVRTVEHMPLEYADTIVNKASCLAGLSDETGVPGPQNRGDLETAIELFTQASKIFGDHGDLARSGLIEQVLIELRSRQS